MKDVIVFSVIAGIIGTGVGGLIGLLFKNKDNVVTSYVLNFSAGIMLSVVFFELLPEALSILDTKYGSLVVILGIAIGMTTIFIVDFFIDKNKNHIQTPTSKNKLLYSGIIMMIAIALHDLPEGIALGSSGATDIKKALPLVVLLALHNIPEGMAISLPLAKGGIKSWLACFLSFVSGAVTVIGAVLGFVLGNISTVATSACLSLASGAMLYVTFVEILPQAYYLSTERNSILFVLFGILIGLLTVCAL